MSAIIGAPTSRRSFLVGTASVLAAGTLPTASADSPEPVRQHTLTAAKGWVSLVGKAHPATDAWCYDGTVPGPVIRARQGEPIRIVVENRLGEGTTVHWHGIRLPIAMGGVPGISQPLIASGERFTYEFTPPDAGTFWYHPHADSLQQLGRGMVCVARFDLRALGSEPLSNSGSSDALIGPQFDQRRPSSGDKDWMRPAVTIQSKHPSQTGVCELG